MGLPEFFTLAEVASRDEDKELWIVLKGSVYNISKFLKLHPGGKQIVLDAAKKNVDITEAFFGPEYHVHSKRALKMLQQYKVGRIVGAPDEHDDEDSAQSAKSNDRQMPVVDFKAAMLPQVRSMPPHLYQKWLLNTNEIAYNLRIFQMDFFEGFSRWPWWYIFLLWIPIVCGMLRASASYGPIHYTVFGYLFGIFTWTFFEYVMHRFAFHVDTDSVLGNTYHFFAHGIHHLSPLDADRLTFPPTFGVGVGVLAYLLVTKCFSESNWCVGFAWYAGMATTYIMYDTMHFYFHHGDPRILPGPLYRYFERQKARHNRHHFVNDQKNFGVTTPIFDMLCGTYED